MCNAIKRNYNKLNEKDNTSWEETTAEGMSVKDMVADVRKELNLEASTGARIA